MKDLGYAKRILGMEITRDRNKRTLFLSQEGYISKVLSRFGMSNAKPVSTPIAQHFKLAAISAEEKEEESKHMESVPYSNAVGSIMYAIVCSRLALAYAASMVNKFMSKLSREH